MATGWHNIAKERLAKDTLNFTTDTIKIILIGTGYTFDPDHQFVSAVVSNEINATNYTRKTATLTITRQDPNDRAVIIVAQPTYTNIGGTTDSTIAGAILFKDTGSDSTSPLIACLDLSPSTITTNGSSITLTFDQTNGNLRLS